MGVTLGQTISSWRFRHGILLVVCLKKAYKGGVTDTPGPPQLRPCMFDMFGREPRKLECMKLRLSDKHSGKKIKKNLLVVRLVSFGFLFLTGVCLFVCLFVFNSSDCSVWSKL